MNDLFFNEENSQKKRIIFSFFKYIILLIIISGIAVCSLITFYYFQIEIDYDKILKYQPISHSVLIDSNGEEIGKFSNSRKQNIVKIEQIDKNIINAFISAEDKTFYKNHGIDFEGIIKAAAKDVVIFLTSKGRLVGASTITQQLVRDIYLSRDRNIFRKVKELIISYKIANNISKDKVMEVFLNHTFLGNGSYGIVSAAKEYFDKDIQELNLSEIAVLASIPKAPSYINPRKNLKRVIERKNWVLERMLLNGYITEDIYNKELQRDIVVAEKKNSIILGNLFSSSVKDILNYNGIDDESINKDGYKIYTTLNSKWQKSLQNNIDIGLENIDKKIGFRGPVTSIEESKINDWQKYLIEMKRHEKMKNDSEYAVVLGFKKNNPKDSIEIGLKNGDKVEIEFEKYKWIFFGKNLSWMKEKYSTKKDIKNCLKIGDIIVIKKEENNKYSLSQIIEIDGSGIIMDSKTGEIRAMSGGFLDLPGTFNRAIQSQRQVGSLAKIFVYSAALNNGYSPSDIFLDIEKEYNAGNSKKGVFWKPKNHDGNYSGIATLRLGFEQSKNTVTLGIAEAIGIKKINDFLRQLSLNDSPELNLSIAIGSFESSPLRIVTSLASFANECKIVEPVFINKVILPNGNEADVRKQDIRTANTIKDDIRSVLYDINSEHLEKGSRFLPEETCYQSISLMEGVRKRGALSLLKKTSIPLGGKTGTTDKGYSIWLSAITPEISVVLFAGYDIPKETDLYGVELVPILDEIIYEIQNDLAGLKFKIPENIKIVSINRKTGERSSTIGGKDIIYEYYKDNDNIPKFKKEIKTNDHADQDWEDGLIY